MTKRRINLITTFKQKNIKTPQNKGEKTMSTTVAQITYRLHVPNHYLGVPFCNVTFTGERQAELYCEWAKMEKTKYNDNTYLIEECKKSIEEIKSNIKELKEQIQKPWYRPWYNKKEKMLLQRISHLQNRLSLYKDRRNKLEDECHFNSSEYLERIEEFLQDKGFIPKNQIVKGTECFTHTDIWIN
jgi:hypothetical protein